VAEIPPVSKAEFEAVVKALLSSAAMKLSDIPRKREPKPKKRAGKKLG
jgi:hypothetical protein